MDDMTHEHKKILLSGKQLNEFFKTMERLHNEDNRFIRYKLCPDCKGRSLECKTCQGIQMVKL